ncbi:POK11 protein, partial [Nyctibius bracteatus]|nr:POK11 protein [Nyctibius bracteatus]
PLTWLSDEPVWVDQWPMTKERLQITQGLVEEQLRAGHIKSSVSPWNTPIFVIPKKSGKWRLLHDLRKINAQMQAMGALQPGIPSPNMLPVGWHKLIVDLKDCFFTIRLHPQDTMRFAFSVPVINKAEPVQHFEWVVLPQGMKNSPTLCQIYVAWALKPLRQLWSQTIIYHYMDDILLCQADPFSEECLHVLTTTLAEKGLVIAPEKIQRTEPWKYLGWVISDTQICPQKVELHTELNNLKDVQTLLGDIQWVRNCVGISTAEIAPLTKLLHCEHPAACVQLTETQRKALHSIAEKVQSSWSSRRIHELPVSFLAINQDDMVCGVICHNETFWVLEWVFLSVQPRNSIQTRPEAIGEVVRRGRNRTVELTGQDPADISIPVNTVDLEWWFRHSRPIQEAFLGYEGRVHSQQSKGRLWQLLRKNQWVERSQVQATPIAGALTVYTDAGKKQRKVVCAWQKDGKWVRHMLYGQSDDTLQTLELNAVSWALTNWLDEALNIVTDSLHVAGVIPRLEDALLRKTQNPCLGQLFLQLRSAMWQRSAPCCVIHVRSHQWDIGL